MEIKHSGIISKLSLFEKASLLKGKNVWETRNIDHVNLPSAFMSDGPHGLRKQAGSADHLGLNPSVPATCFPTAAALANSWDEGLLEEIGQALGDEAAALDVNVLLGPGLNIKRSPLCGRNFEYFSEDPLLSGKLAAAMIRGIQSRNVAACPKHFAANSQELLRMGSDSIVDERTLREIYLTAFEIVVKESKPKSIMSSYNKINGAYAHENHWLLTDVLRNEWGFNGAVISDWGGVNDVVLSAKNGGTMEMPGGGLDSARQIIAAIEKGELKEETLNQRVDEVIELVMGTKGLREAETQSGKKPVDPKAHHLLARKAAGRGAVLLKNESGILPLNKGVKVSLIGEFARTVRFQGAGSSQVNAAKVDTAMEMIKDSGLDCIGFAPGYRFNKGGDAALTEEALSLAQKSDVILFYLGLPESGESEGIDRVHIDLPENQIALLNALAETGKPIVAVLTSGSVIGMEWAAKTKAVIHGFLHGEAGAGALIDIITGKINPSGKLAETYPIKLEDTPVFGNYPSENRTAEYREGPYVGYRYYETTDIPVAYPFGFGLSYTTFEYSDLTIDTHGAAFTIANKGGMDGEEITQMYVTQTGNNGIFRPAKELKGFKRVSLKKGENARVHIPFDERTFRYFDINSKKWATGGGEYKILIGASVRDIRLDGTISINGTVDKSYDIAAFPSYHSGKIKSVSDEEFSALLGQGLPSKEWYAGGVFEANSAMRHMDKSKSLLLRLVSKIIKRKTVNLRSDGKPDLNMIFVYNMSFRALARNAGQVVSIEMVKGIVDMANGRFFKGASRVIGGFFRNRKANKQGEKKLQEGAK